MSFAMLPTLEERLLAIGGALASVSARLADTEYALIRHQAELRDMIRRFEEYAAGTHHVEHSARAVTVIIQP